MSDNGASRPVVVGGDGVRGGGGAGEGGHGRVARLSRERGRWLAGLWGGGKVYQQDTGEPNHISLCLDGEGWFSILTIRPNMV